MPNHVSQRFTITADASTLEKIKETTRITVQRNGAPEVHAFSQNAFFPMPEGLKGTVSGSNNVVTEEEYAAYMSDEARVARDKAMGVGSPITADVALKLQIKYGHNNWYDWANENWGTKWGVYEVAEEWDEGEGTISIIFQSAWSPITKIALKLSELFPAASFRLEYIDEGYNFAGWEVIKDGSVLQEERVECENSSNRFRALADSVGYTICEDEEDDDE